MALFPTLSQPLAPPFLPLPAWWCWADAFVYQRSVEGESYPFKYNWPGIAASVALILINSLPKRDLDEAAESGEEGADLRARLWLLASWLVAFAAVCGSIATLVSCTQAERYVGVGVASVVQCGLILASALLFWAFRSDEGSAYTYY